MRPVNSMFENAIRGRRNSADHGRRDSVDLDKEMASSNLCLSKILNRDHLSEVQLHKIKVGLGLIEELWRDFSMGSNYIAHSQIVSVHKCVKEIGKELYSSIFIEQTLTNQVLFKTSKSK